MKITKLDLNNFKLKKNHFYILIDRSTYCIYQVISENNIMVSKTNMTRGFGKSGWSLNDLADWLSYGFEHVYEFHSLSDIEVILKRHEAMESLIK